MKKLAVSVPKSLNKLLTHVKNRSINASEAITINLTYLTPNSSSTCYYYPWGCVVDYWKSARWCTRQEILSSTSRQSTLRTFDRVLWLSRCCDLVPLAWTLFCPLLIISLPLWVRTMLRTLPDKHSHFLFYRGRRTW